MQFMLMDYVRNSGWEALTRTEQERWLGAYKGYLQAMQAAGVLLNSAGLQPASTAATVRTVDDKLQVLDGPYADTKEQLGGFHFIEVPDLAAALAWAARSPTALHGAVEVRPVSEKAILTTDIREFIKPE